MEDIVPGLLKKIQDDFKFEFDKSEVISALYAKVRDGTATYKEANDFAIEVGEILAGAYKNNISSAVLPDGRMYYNIANRIITPTMTNNYDIITDVTEQVQKSLNEAAGIGMKAIIPELNQDRIRGIVNRASAAIDFGDIAWILDEPVANFSQSIVDDSIRANAEFQAKAGLAPVITRKIAGKCCDWCKALAGTYSYPYDVPEDVYRRHQRCRCTVDYNPRSGKVQNVHSKQWRSEDVSVIEERKNIGQTLTKRSAKEAADFQNEIDKRQGEILEIPTVSDSAINKMTRKELETLAATIYANKAKKQGLTISEGVRRARLLMDGNTDAQLKKYIKNNK